MHEVEEEGKINWHLGFQGGMELELRPWRAALRFDPEKELSKEALWLDLLITRQDKDLEMDHPIGRRMRIYNVLEYKSPEDALSINDFSKAVGSALLCAGLGQRVNEMPLDQLAVFLLRDSYPRELLAELRRLNMDVRESETEPGIYEIESRLGLAIYLVVTGRMKQASCPVLHLLRKHADTAQAGAFLSSVEQWTEPGDLDNIRAVLNIVLAANPDILEWLRRNAPMRDVLRELAQPWIDEGEKRGEKRGLREVAGNMLRSKLPLRMIMELSTLSEEEVREVAGTIGVSTVPG